MSVWTGLNIDAIVEGVLRQLQAPSRTMPAQAVVEEVSLPVGRGQLWPATDSVPRVGLGSELPQVVVPATRTDETALIRQSFPPAKGSMPQKVESQLQAESGRSRERCDLRVITAGSLEGLVKPGLRELEVLKNAVLTPSAVEFLRAKRVTVVRSASIEREVSLPATTRVDGGQKPRAAQDQLDAETSIIVGRNSSEISSAVAAVKREFKSVRSRIGGTAEEIADEIVREVSRGGVGRAIVVAERAESIAIRANRQSAVRAIVGHTVQQLRSAVRESECNVVVVSPAGRTVFELLNLFRASLKTVAAD